MLTCSSDWTAKLWSVDLCVCKRTFSGHDFWVNSIAPSADGAWLVTASRDHTVRVWRTDTGVCELTIGDIWSTAVSKGTHVDFVSSASFLPLNAAFTPMVPSRLEPSRWSWSLDLSNCCAILRPPNRRRGSAKSTA